MPLVRISNITRPNLQPLEVHYCATFISRLRGLMFKKEIGPHQGIFMVQDSESRVNSAIHMFFMNFDIATIWLDNHMRVVDAKVAYQWQPAVAPKAPARYILETHPDRLSEFVIGDQIELVHI